MSESTPPPKLPEDPTPIPPLPPISVVRSAPSKPACAAIGFLILLVSGGLTYIFAPFCLLGFAAAVASLFFPGYRCIFLGYILTIGLLLLIMIVWCSTQPFDMK